MKTILAQMLEEYKERSSGYDRMIRLKLEELALLVERSLPRICPAVSSDGSSTIEEIVGYIRAHYSERFTLSSLARLCGLNPSFFPRVFKKNTGMPVFAFINRVRIRNACGLFKRTEMSIIEIAFAAGYNNVSFFNRYFRKLNGMSPWEYRKHIRR